MTEPVQNIEVVLQPEKKPLRIEYVIVDGEPEIFNILVEGVDIINYLSDDIIELIEIEFLKQYNKENQ